MLTGISNYIRAYCTIILLLKLISFMGLRVSSREEAVGLDIAAHGEEGYRIVPQEEMPEPALLLQEEGSKVYSSSQKE